MAAPNSNTDVHQRHREWIGHRGSVGRVVAGRWRCSTTTNLPTRRRRRNLHAPQAGQRPHLPLRRQHRESREGWDSWAIWVGSTRTGYLYPGRQTESTCSPSAAGVYPGRDQRTVEHPGRPQYTSWSGYLPEDSGRCPRADPHRRSGPRTRLPCGLSSPNDWRFYKVPRSVDFVDTRFATTPERRDGPPYATPSSRDCGLEADRWQNCPAGDIAARDDRRYSQRRSAFRQGIPIRA